ncbi:hypothetical protein NL676_007478 [Syzygium grande]|nr:hypothetical protein NL676_007478 [Syzygium grande]
MAKGRRLTSSRSERLLGSYGGGGYGYGADGSEAAEFDEDDVWSAVDHGGGGADDRGEDGGENSQLGWAPEEGGGGGGGGGRRGRGGVPRGGLSLAFEDSGVRPSSRIVHQFRGNDAGVASSSPRGHGDGDGHGHHHMATSAPVNVPDWSKIYRVDSVESMHDSDDGLEEERGAEMVPPHEYLAREYARSQQAAATSVFEGVGRTLKGRDMRRMRDAVWSQTGFDG